MITARKHCAPFVLLMFLFGLIIISPSLPAFAGTGPSTQVPAFARTQLTTAVNPFVREVRPPSPFDAITRLLVSTPTATVGCSGVLLNTRMHVLTAAHCITDEQGALNANALTARFNFTGGTQDVAGSRYFLPPGWNGDFRHGSDIAVVQLASIANGTGYDVFRDTRFIGGIADRAGYGASGTGQQGEVLPFGTLRSGKNRLDTFWSDIPGEPFAFDFDNGTVARDTIGNIFGIRDLGTGSEEVMTGAGDSGSPAFINWQIAGIHSFTATFGPPFDLDNGFNSTFGELGGDTRVAEYLPWIESVVVLPTPEPSSILLFAVGALLLLFQRFVRK